MRSHAHCAPSRCHCSLDLGGVYAQHPLSALRQVACSVEANSLNVDVCLEDVLPCPQPTASIPCGRALSCAKGAAYPLLQKVAWVALQEIVCHVVGLEICYARLCAVQHAAVRLGQKVLHEQLKTCTASRIASHSNCAVAHTTCLADADGAHGGLLAGDTPEVSAVFFARLSEGQIGGERTVAELCDKLACNHSQGVHVLKLEHLEPGRAKLVAAEQQRAEGGRQELCGGDGGVGSAQHNTRRPRLKVVMVTLVSAAEEQEEGQEDERGDEETAAAAQHEPGAPALTLLHMALGFNRTLSSADSTKGRRVS